MRVWTLPSPLLGHPRARGGQPPARGQGFRPRELGTPLKHSAVDFCSYTGGMSPRSHSPSCSPVRQRGSASGRAEGCWQARGEAERPQGSYSPSASLQRARLHRRMPLWLLVHLGEETYAGYPTGLRMLIAFCQMATCKEQGHVLIGY